MSAGVPHDHEAAIREKINRLATELARVSRELSLANETIRLYETSQIPMIPRGAQARMKALEREHETMRDALERAWENLAAGQPEDAASVIESALVKDNLAGSRAATPEDAPYGVCVCGLPMDEHGCPGGH